MSVVILVLLYLVQMIVCCVIHARHGSRIPNGVWDFIKLMFLPYVLYKLYRKEDL